jgi:hypothetical protein
MVPMWIIVASLDNIIKQPRWARHFHAKIEHIKLGIHFLFIQEKFNPNCKN